MFGGDLLFSLSLAKISQIAIENAHLMSWFEINFSHPQVTSISAVLAKNCVGVAARKCGCLEAIPSHRSGVLYDPKHPPPQYKALLMGKKTEKEKHTSSNDMDKVTCHFLPVQLWKIIEETVS